MHDHSAGTLYQVDLVVAEPDAVDQLHVRPEGVQGLQPLDVPQAARRQLHVDLGPGFGHMDVGANAPQRRHLAGSAHGCVRAAPGDQWAELQPQPASRLAVNSAAPEEVRQLAKVLRNILAGNLHPDLSALPPELADLVRRALEE